ncbi:unnamed protein product, partial [Ectocarpus sp. 13 AM-2016]
AAAGFEAERQHERWWPAVTEQRYRCRSCCRSRYGRCRCQRRPRCRHRQRVAATAAAAAAAALRNGAGVVVPGAGLLPGFSSMKDGGVNIDPAPPCAASLPISFAGGGGADNGVAAA